ncbi:hypothetical protein [Rhodosalinus sp. FB01]|uniref:hypothetical protein n=1 Tax=Rhodosalinus sp. FB01 TaxID=3239194 RepID=UPI003523EA89
MLPADNAEYKLNQCFALFTGILCWTMQRIQTEPRDEDAISQAMKALTEDLKGQTFHDLVRLCIRTVGDSDGSQPTDAAPLPLNDFSAFQEADQPFNAFRTLKALRNAVAHGDARRVLPVNQNTTLIGYRLICRENGGWEGEVLLDRHAMAEIAGTLADRFCEAIAALDPSAKDNGSALVEEPA